MPKISAVIERFQTARPFVIARGTKTAVDVITASVRGEDGAEGRGEGTPVYYRGEDASGALAAIRALGEVSGRAELAGRLPPGAARNAADCALWAWEARRSGTPVWRLAGLPAPPAPVRSAFTISLGDPAAMAEAARAAPAHRLLKLKLSGDGGDRDRVAAVRAAAPGATLIADANEGWGALDLEAEAAAMARLGVALIEQPLPAGADAALARRRPAVPFCADESCHTRADLDEVEGRYGLINIKLDKAGGLTEALALRSEAARRGLGVMVGCMLSTSLGVAPALLLAQGAAFADLDGPLLLARDRAGGLGFAPDGTVTPAPPGLWD